MTLLLVVIIAILILLSMQLRSSNVLKQKELEMKIRTKNDTEIDEFLKHHYPHLFYEMKDTLRQHYFNMLASDESYKKALAYGSESVNGPVVSATQILLKIQNEIINPNVNKKKLEERISELVKFSNRVLGTISKDREITDSEKSYIKFLVMKRLYESIYKPERILELDTDTMMWWFEEYMGFFPMRN